VVREASCYHWAIRSLPHAKFTGPECRDQKLYMDADWTMQHCPRWPYIPSADGLFLPSSSLALGCGWLVQSSKQQQQHRRSTSILALVSRSSESLKRRWNVQPAAAQRPACMRYKPTRVGCTGVSIGKMGLLQGRQRSGPPLNSQSKAPGV